MSLLLAALPALLPLAEAQGLPSGDAIVSLFNNVAPSEGLWRVPRTGPALPISGLAGAGSAGIGVNSLQLDPIDDRIWIGGINNGGNTNGQVNWIRLSATNSVAQFTQHGTTGLASSVAAIAFDDNGNPIIATGRNSGGGGIFRIDRHTGASTRIASLANGLHNALTRDADGNLYIGLFDNMGGPGGGEVHRMQKNADCTYQAPVRLGTISEQQLSGVEWCPDPLGGNNHSLVMTTWGSTFEMPAVGGAARVLPDRGFWNWVEYDARQNDFLLCDDGSGPSDVFSLSRDYSTWLLHARLLGGAAGLTSCIDVNDAKESDIHVLPACPRRDVPNPIEIGVSCPPGQIAILHIVSPVAVPILVAPAPGHGRVFAQIPGVVVPAALAPGSIVLQAACFDPATNQLSIGRQVAWPAN